MAYTIFKTTEGERQFLAAYDRLLAEWPVPYDTMELPTRFGSTHIITAGRKDAEPLLLLHGMTFNSTMWRDNIGELSAQYRVYCVDVLGDFGKSKVIKPLQTEADCVQWLNDVLDALGLAKVHLMGHSMGGWLALNYALNAPERIERLVLLAPVGSLFRIPFKFMVKAYPALLLPSRRRIRRAWDWFLAKGNRLDDSVMTLVEAAWTHCRILLRVMPKRFEESKLRGLEPRTLFIVGDEEVIYDAGKAVKRVRELMPNVETEIVTGASHCLNTEQKDIVNARVLRFLQA